MRVHVDGGMGGGRFVDVPDDHPLATDAQVIAPQGEEPDAKEKLYDPTSVVPYSGVVAGEIPEVKP